MQQQTEQGEAGALRIGGVTPFTTIDYPGKLSAVLFIKGCPWNCLYCQNPDLRHREFAAGDEVVDWPAVEKFLTRRKGLIDGVVLSGGEPCVDPALPAAARKIKAMGYAVGLHTAGMYPERLREMRDALDWVGLDVKAPLTDPSLYDRIVRRKGAAAKVKESLTWLLNSGIDLEVRTTAHPDYLSLSALTELTRDLSERGVRKFVLQIYRQPPGAHSEDLLENVTAEYPGAAFETHARAQFPVFEIRRSY